MALGITKAVSRAFSDLSTTLTYTVFLKNPDSITISNVYIIDTIPNGTTFVSGSVAINGVTSPSATLTSPGIDVGTIPQNKTTIVTYNVLISSTIPNPNPLVNYAQTTYSYQTIPSGALIFADSLSNSALTTITTVTLSTSKEVDKAYASIGDILTYTIPITNNGTTLANAIVLVDTLPITVSLVPYSLKQDGITILGTLNPPGVSLYNISAGVTSTVTFQLLVNSLPTSSEIRNSVCISYRYPISDYGEFNCGAISSNIALTTIMGVATVYSIKSVDKGYSDVSETLKYTVALRNIGSITANNVYVIDTIPSGTTFVLGSVAINGVTSPTATLTSPGINIGNISAKGATTVSYSVKVSSTIPSPNPLVNYIQTTFSYQSIPGAASTFIDTLSNSILTTISTATVISSKQVDKVLANIGDILTYTIPITNNGTTTACNIVLIDTLPVEVTLVNNSFKQDNIILSGSPNPPGATLYSIPFGATSTITFQVVVVSLPSASRIINNATFKYKYTIDQSKGTFGCGNSYTNSVLTTIAGSASLGSNKYVDRVTADLNTTLKYTVALRNSGSVTANNVYLIDTIPNGTSFVYGSVQINGVTYPFENPAPPGINIGSIAVNQRTTVTFNVLIASTIPSPIILSNVADTTYSYQSIPGATSTFVEVLSNSVSTQISTATILSSKQVDKSYANIGDILTYTIPMTNGGTTLAKSIVFVDTLSSSVKFINGSFKQDCCTIPGNPNPPSGISIYDIEPGITSTISFQVLVVSLPSTSEIPNSASIRYIYPIGSYGVGVSNTNIVVTTIAGTANLSLIKAVDKSYSDISETLTYTVVVNNSGPITANNVVLIDTLPNGVSFVAGSVVVNGIPRLSFTPTSIAVGNIASNNSSTVTFRGIVSSTIPSPNPVTNSIQSTYSYQSIPGALSTFADTISNPVSTTISTATISSSKEVDITLGNIGDVLTYTIPITNTGTTITRSLVFIDTISSSATLIGGLIKQDGIIILGNPSPPGISLYNISPGQTSTITFKLLVNSLPSSSAIVNSGTVKYSYVIDPKSLKTGNGNSYTNEVVTTIAGSASVDIIKAVNEDYSDLNEVLKYTVVLRNRGIVTANNVFVIDTLPNGVSFVTGSVAINGVTSPSSTLTSPGINVGNISVNGVTTVTFYGLISSTIPTPNPVVNLAETTFSYQSIPGSPSTFKENISESVLVTINHVELTGSKLVNENFGSIGDVLTYTIPITNLGTTITNGLVLIDTLPASVSMVFGSMTQDGIALVGTPNPPGVILYEIEPGITSTVTFKVRVNSLPTSSVVRNSANISYRYIINPEIVSFADGATNTNTVLTTIGAPANIELDKYVDKGYSDCCSILKYTVVVNNTGAMTANNVYIIDTIPTGTSFVSGSVQINGVVNGGADPTPPGINLGNMAPNQVITVTFNVQVSATIPAILPLSNYSETTYSYVSLPGGATTFTQSTSPVAITTISTARLMSSKEVNTLTANVGDILTYTIPITNTGTAIAMGIVLIDTLPSGVNLVAGSLTQDGLLVSGSPNPPGANLYNIQAGRTSTVTFKIKINTMQPTGVILNSANLRYGYIVDPNIVTTGVGYNNTNITSTTIIATASVSISKSVDNTYVDLNSTVKYTIMLTNNGSTAANNIYVVDTLPTALSFVNGSVFLNGIPYPGAVLTNPGIQVGNLQINQSIAVSFNAIVTTVPSPNTVNNLAQLIYNYVPTFGSTPISYTTLSNSISNIINHSDLIASKIVNLGYAQVDDILTYTIPITNIGSVQANNLVLVDTIPQGLTFISNSLTQDGITIFGSPGMPGVTLYSILPGATSTVTFKAKVSSLPYSGNAVNIGTIGYNYFVNPILNIKGFGTVVTNAAVTTIVSNSIGTIKGADKYYARCGDIITFTITMPNTGNTTAFNVILTDTIPLGTDFISNSVTVNGIPQAGASPIPPTGINVGTIPKGGYAIVTFKVVVAC